MPSPIAPPEPVDPITPELPPKAPPPPAPPPDNEGEPQAPVELPGRPHEPERVG